METWNRQELYAEIWEQPFVKVAAKYGISAVVLRKVCRKLQIPLPGRGYWTKKEFGKPVEKLPLPEARNVPIVHRFKFSRPPDYVNSSALPTDVEYRRIVEFESRSLAVDLPESAVFLARLCWRRPQSLQPTEVRTKVWLRMVQSVLRISVRSPSWHFYCDHTDLSGSAIRSPRLRILSESPHIVRSAPCSIPRGRIFRQAKGQRRRKIEEPFPASECD